MVKTFGLVSIALAAALCWTADSAFAAGTVSGKVGFKGTAPAPKKVNVTKDKEVCGKTEMTSDELVVGGDGGIQYAVVRLDGAAGKTSPATLEFDQKGCKFQQHVLVVPVESKVNVNNHDGILHNFHMSSFENDEVNFGQPGDMKTKTVEGAFAYPEIAEVKCDVHEWMKAWFVITDHPFVAVSGADGSFKIENVPAGNYTVRVWHESLGESEQEIAVKDGENKVDFSLGK
jgi:hypothetical protein